MPLYQYECRCGKKMEVFHKINRVPKRARCVCGWMAKKVIVTGGIQCDSINDVKWLESARQNLQPDSELKTHPIETRGQYNRYLKDHHLACRG